jgi:hypothetical protein
MSIIKCIAYSIRYYPWGVGNLIQADKGETTIIIIPGANLNNTDSYYDETTNQARQMTNDESKLLPTRH